MMAVNIVIMLGKIYKYPKNQKKKGKYEDDGKEVKKNVADETETTTPLTPATDESSIITYEIHHRISDINHQQTPQQQQFPHEQRMYFHQNMPHQQFPRQQQIPQQQQKILQDQQISQQHSSTISDVF